MRVEHHDRLQSLSVDAYQLAGELKQAVRGEVRFDDGSRALYATDASNYRQVPIGVVIPRDVDDVDRHRRPGPQARRADPRTRRGHEPGRPVLQRGGRAGHVEVHAPHHRR